MAQLVEYLIKLSDEDLGSILRFLLKRIHESGGHLCNGRAYSCKHDIIEIEMLCVGVFLVVAFLQSGNVAVGCCDGVSECYNASTPTRPCQSRSDIHTLRNIDQLIEVLMATLVKSLQAVMRLRQQAG